MNVPVNTSFWCAWKRMTLENTREGMCFHWEEMIYFRHVSWGHLRHPCRSEEVGYVVLLIRKNLPESFLCVWLENEAMYAVKKGQREQTTARNRGWRTLKPDTQSPGHEPAKQPREKQKEVLSWNLQVTECFWKEGVVRSLILLHTL